MKTRITVNGLEYGSPDEMPPDVREQYQRAMSLLADKNGNGVPDNLEGGDVRVSSWDPGSAVVTSAVTSQKYVVNGRAYQRWEDIPSNPAQPRPAGS